MKKVERKTSTPTTSTKVLTPMNNDKALKDLETKCYKELYDIISGIAGALDVSVNSIMNMVAIRAMSQQLPENEADMLKIPHVTKANFEKYGKALLDITLNYAAQKKGLHILN